MPITFVKSKIHVLPDGRMTAADAAIYLGLSVKTLANWRVLGKGPRWVRAGRRPWYFISDLEDLISKGVRETSYSIATGEGGQKRAG